MVQSAKLVGSEIRRGLQVTLIEHRETISREEGAISKKKEHVKETVTRAGIVATNMRYGNKEIREEVY